MCVILTALSVVFTHCPPAPDEWNTSIFKSFGFISMFTLSSITGVTSTDANDVCLLVFESNGDILTSLCTPFSFFKYPYAFIPFTIIDMLFIPVSNPFCYLLFLLCNLFLVSILNTFDIACLPSHKLLFLLLLSEFLILHRFYHIHRLIILLFLSLLILFLVWIISSSASSKASSVSSKASIINSISFF